MEGQTDVDTDTRSRLASVRESIAGHGSKVPAEVVSDSSVGTGVTLALEVVQSMRAALDTLVSLSDCGDIAIEPSQVASARQCLDLVHRSLGAAMRTDLARQLTGIYVIVDPEATRGRPVTDVAMQSLEGGAKIVQLRDKLNDKGPMLETARELKSICEAHDALFVMNDHADLARASGADVLHVGQTDLPVSEARQILRPDQLIGNSNGSMEEARQSVKDSVDYVAVGAIYSTTTMGKTGRRALGPEMIERVRETVDQPIVAIGGINSSNIVDVVKAGANSVCVVSAITFADDPKAATEELVELYESASR